jgi:hypothetical protein
MISRSECPLCGNIWAIKSDANLISVIPLFKIDIETLWACLRGIKPDAHGDGCLHRYLRRAVKRHTLFRAGLLHNSEYNIYKPLYGFVFKENDTLTVCPNYIL